VSSDFLQAVCLLATYTRRVQAIESGIDVDKAPAISCKRKDVLKLTLEDYKTWVEPVTEGFKKAAKFLHGLKLFTARDLPYRTQLTPMAAMFALLGDKGEHDGVKRKISRWYWCGVLGELYGGSIETRFAKDLPEVLNWIDGGAEPDTIGDANFAPTRLLSLRTRNSAAYKGLHALLIRHGGQDFRTGDEITDQLYFDEKVDIHHIFPQKWCRENSIDTKHCNSIINKTPISAKTNRMISGKAPSVYLARIQKSAEISDRRMDRILASHLIESSYLRADDFENFFKAREEALLDIIEKAMGKPVARDSVEFEDSESVDDEEDEVEVGEGD
jgi:hypothetical protein